MNKTKYLYYIYDIIEKDYLIVNARSSEVTAMIDMPHEYIKGYCESGYVYNGRYIISRKKIEDVVKLVESKPDVPMWMWEEFTKQAEYIRSLASEERLKQIRIVPPYPNNGGVAG